jgi:phenylpropionate dioxygenase-like ring-hydroxylating dioxygenase large terminal subunit
VTALIPNIAYFAPDVLDREIDHLFSSGWEFVGLADELANDRDFVTIEYRNTSIVVQNFKGELKSFQNICTHRFNQLQTAERGNRPLVCSYHGWRFNERGCPIGVASRIVNDAADDDLCLTRYRVESCGQFVFVTRNDGPATLRDYLGRFYEVLESLSSGMGEVTHHDTVPHQANWKILVENVIDNSHCPVLHNETFVAFGFCRKPVEETVIDGPHSSWHVPRVEIAREGLRRRALAHLDARHYRHDSFFHIHIFPNLFVASTEGASFYIGHALPTGAEQTMLRVRYLAPALELDDRHRTKQSLLNDQTKASGLRIVEEDRPILERIQRGVRLSTKPGALLDNEPRIASFMQVYDTAMA